MRGDREDSEVKPVDPLRTCAREWRRHGAEALTGALDARGRWLTGDVISPDADEGRDSVRSSAGTAWRRSTLMIIMRYQDSRIRDKRWGSSRSMMIISP